MIVFKNYFKILKKYSGIIIMYTSILLVFTIILTQNNNKIGSFTASKPGIAIINLDENTKITQNLIEYMNKNAEIKEIENDKQKLEDALFYQDISAIIYIYDGYTNDFLNNQEKALEVKFGTDYDSSYSKMLLERYLKIADIVNDTVTNQDEIIETINQAMENETKVEIQSTIDTSALSSGANFFNFANYSIISICVFAVSIVLFRFNEEKVKKRNNVSSKKTSEITKELFLGNLVFSLVVWGALMAFSFIFANSAMTTTNGIFFMINSFVFMICALAIGFLIGNIIHSENVISAIVNIIGLGTSFLCGCFIPAEYLPPAVVTFSKILPSYYFVSNNNLIKTIEVFDGNAITQLAVNMGIMLVFAIIFMTIANVIAKKQKRVN